MNKISFIATLLMVVSWCMAQNSPMRFQSITINDGLSLSSVYCIAKDSKGFMWFGTEDGLNRFDGYKFEIYRTDVKNPNSICYKWIEHIEEDEAGMLWFGSRNGLSHFNPVTKTFKNFHSRQENSIQNDTVTSLVSYDSEVYVGTKQGLSVFNTASLSCATYKGIDGVNTIIKTEKGILIAASNGLFQLSKNNELTMLCDFNVRDVSILDELIVCAHMSGIQVFDCKSEEWTIPHLKDKLSDIESIEVDKKGRIWINAQNGLWLYNLSTKSLKKIIDTQQTSNSLAINSSKVLYIDDHANVWYATHGDGLFIINHQLEVTKCVHNPTDKESINQNAFNCIYADTVTGNIWLGTYGAGINIYHPAANKFDLLKHNPLNENSLPSNFIWSIFETKDSCLWIGTNDKGVCHYCPKADKYTSFEHQPNNSYSLSNNSIREVFEDSDATIWLGTDGGGLNRYNPSTRSFTRYVYDKEDERSISDNSVRVVFEDSGGQMWVGTRNGLNLFDKEKGYFKRFIHQPDDPASLSHNFVYASIIESKDGALWIGTYGGGLNRLNLQDYKFKHYTSDGEEGKRLSNNIVFSVYEDENGFIWVGTNEGLNILNPTTGDVKILGMKDGLPNEVIYSILPDGMGNVWLSTNHGICRINQKTLKCVTYDVSDGLQSNEFNGGAFHSGRSGRLYFGGVYGLNILNPEILQTNTTVSQPVITRLEVLGNVVDVSGLAQNKSVVEQDSQVVMPTDISYTKHITLDYEQRFFALEFSGLNHLFPGKTHYAFQLSPMDKKWNKAGLRNYVSFANVKPGDYQFKVVSTNSDGVWSDKVATLGITIRPPFWQTTWFIFLEIALLLVLISFGYWFLLKIKTNKLLRAQNERIKNANALLHRSEENLRHMNITKDKFFSIISHDLKNPFTSLMSISSMLDENYQYAEEDDKRDAVKRINHSVKNIYLLLENLLTWSRSQRGKICFQKKDFNLSVLISENINLYKAAADKKGIQFINEVNEEVIAIGDRNTINTIIRNLSGNAIKFTPSGGKIKYTIIKEDGFWKVSIQDSGVGIKGDDQERLFCIDKKLKTDGTDGEKGTGLGLIICKEFAEKNGGEIGVMSQSGTGSTFWFTVKA
ncbi:ligand-binding sensor domain-containing protein [Carboxylicivirga marina]|uniref:ligand-binding sensor domain-containing protein n=1 Tax=Carboxylicivirga marina TaxID=2800988 RepID=UPI002592B52C|nr:two-component regulator propeller domain-containing protein [uncultured Carboxylicivirga sp.]